MRKDRRKPYTLIEIVTVIAIAAIVITLIGVAFENLGGSTNVDAAASEVGNALSLAQSQAASRRKYVAMIVAPPNNTVSKIEDRAYSAVRLAYVEKPVSAGTGQPYAAKFIGWIPAGDWTVLPLGTAILSIAEPGSKGINGNPPTDWGNLGSDPTDMEANYNLQSTVKFTDLPSSLPDATTRGLVFSPKGVLYPTREVGLLIASAMLADNGKDLVFQGKDSDRLLLRVNQFTGVISYEAAPQ